jgi:hypothetical protein
MGPEKVAFAERARLQPCRKCHQINPAKQLAEKVFCGSDFGFVGAPDFSPAIEVGLIPGFSPALSSKDRQYSCGNWRTAPGLKPAFFAAISPA